MTSAQGPRRAGRGKAAQGNRATPRAAAPKTPAAAPGVACGVTRSGGLWRQGQQKKEAPPKALWADGGASKQKAAASYSPALRRSTIGAAGLNFSVRDGKRWNPGAMATWICRAPWKWPRSSSATGGASRGKTGHAGRTGGAHKARRENLIRAGSFRAISSARLWRRRLYTCALSTS